MMLVLFTVKCTIIPWIIILTTILVVTIMKMRCNEYILLALNYFQKNTKANIIYCYPIHRVVIIILMNNLNIFQISIKNITLCVTVLVKIKFFQEPRKIDLKSSCDPRIGQSEFESAQNNCTAFVILFNCMLRIK